MSVTQAEGCQGSGQPCGLCTTRIDGLGVTKGRDEILRDVNLDVHCGELVGLVGPNGAGKTTLLKAILGEVRHSGRITFLGSHGAMPKPPRVGYVPQKLDLDSGSPTSVLDLIAATHSSVPVWLAKPRRVRTQAEVMLEAVQAEHLVDKRLGSLSGGELQRVLLALALDPVPQLLLLDEPVSGIDLKGLEVFYDMVAGLRRSYSLSVLLVSHDLPWVAVNADRVAFLDRTIVQCGAACDVFASAEAAEAFGEGVCAHVGVVPPG